MKTNRLTLPLFFIMLAVGLTSIARGADRASIHGILISASNDKGETDRRLSPYEPNLRRILRFESYRFLGDGDASLGPSEKGHLSLGEGHELEIESESSEGNSVRLKVRWIKGGKVLMNTGLILRSGVPAIIGGPSTNNKNDVYAVILIGR